MRRETRRSVPARPHAQDAQRSWALLFLQHLRLDFAKPLRHSSTGGAPWTGHEAVALPGGSTRHRCNGREERTDAVHRERLPCDTQDTPCSRAARPRCATRGRSAPRSGTTYSLPSRCTPRAPLVPVDRYGRAPRPVRSRTTDHCKSVARASGSDDRIATISFRELFFCDRTPVHACALTSSKSDKARAGRSIAHPPQVPVTGKGKSVQLRHGPATVSGKPSGNRPLS